MTLRANTSGRLSTVAEVLSYADSEIRGASQQSMCASSMSLPFRLTD